MFVAKKSGRNRVESFESWVNAEEDEHELESHSENEFSGELGESVEWEPDL